MIDSAAPSEVVLALAEEFLERYRKGERPQIKEYVGRHPELAGAIREIFPAMAMMEKIAIADDSQGGKAGRPLAGAALTQLGDYRIVREIGRGGMGIVYEAEQVSLGRHVALKVLPNKALLDVRHKRRFDREARSAAKLHHTNIVPVFGVGEQDGLPYYVMQFIQGLGMNEVLDELIRQQGHGTTIPHHTLAGEVSATDLARSLLDAKLHGSGEAAHQRRGEETTQDLSSADRSSANRASADSSVSSDSSVVLPGQSDAPESRKQTYWQSIANIGVQVASALDYAHTHGVLHRDIKPSNLLLDRRGTVWVTDFGLAKSNDQENLTHTGDVVGTLLYMPPEAFEGKGDCRSDVYSLGLTLYELLAMRPAFSEKDRTRLIRQVTTMEPARLGKLNPAIPRDLVTIVHKAIERNAAHRYASAAELGADLRRFLDDEPIQARPISGPERLWRWCRRRPAQAAAGAFALLLLAALVALPLTLAVTESRNAAALAKEKLKVDEALRQANRQAAVLALEQALGVCEQGDVARGLLLLARGLAKAHEAGAEDLEQAFRWNLGAWSRQNHELVHVLNHGAAVHAVAFSSDNKRIATAGADNQVRLWDAATGLPLGAPLAHPGPIQALAVHPDGKLLTGCEDGAARLWDFVTGAQVGPTLVHYRPDAGDGIKAKWPYVQGIASVGISPDSRVIVTGGFDGCVKRWELESGRTIGGPFSCSGGITGVAFHPKGRFLLTTGTDRTWRLWDTVTERMVSSKNTGSNLWAVAVDPLGSKFAVGLQQGRGARQWPMPDVAVSDALRPMPKASAPYSGLLRHYETVTSLAYTRDGRLLLAGSNDRTARFWDTASGKPFGSTLRHRDFVHAVAVSADNRLALTGSTDGTACVWRIARGSKTHTLPHPGWVRGGPTFDRQSKTVFTGGEGLKVLRWNVATGRPEGPPFVVPPRPGDGWITGIALSPDDKVVYAADHASGKVHFWDTGTGRLVGSTPPHGDEVWRLAISPDGRTLLTGTWGAQRGPGARSARLWDARTGQPIGPLLQHEGGVRGLSFHPDGTKVLTGSDDRTTRLWNAASAETLGPPLVHPSAVKAVAFRPDGLAIALGSTDRTAQVWDPATWTAVGPAMQHDGEVNCVAYNPQGDLLLTASADFTARIWHVATGKPVGPALRHARDVTGVSCSPDGRIAATTSDDSTAGLWSMPVPIDDDYEQVWRWAQRVTGLTLDEQGAFHVLFPDEVARLTAR